MGLLDNTTQRKYYTNENEYGSYQFTSLDDIINQFQIAYVGQDKIIPRIKRADIAFHAMRAMQELSFDTFKSIKSQEIAVPATLQMILPHDYVNYTKLSWVDSAGIKHNLYPTSKTSNPTSPFQNDAGGFEIITKGTGTGGKYVLTLDDQYDNILVGMKVEGVGMQQNTRVEALKVDSGITTVTLDKEIDLFAQFNPGGTGTVIVGETINSGEYRFMSRNDGLIIKPKTQVLKENASTKQDRFFIDFATAQTGIAIGDLVSHEFFPIGTYVTSIAAQSGEAYGTRIYVSQPSSTTKQGANQEITFTSPTPADSAAWSKYKAATPSENNDYDYEDDTFWPNDGRRYGLDPQHAQANGSFYIDQQLGKIHFSSNISGRTVILDYISDGLGTDEEMQVHKFAEEAMYKHILCGIMSGRANVGRNQLAYYKKEKFAAVRTAKLRLSNIKLEELTQILRGKSKHIKH